VPPKAKFTKEEIVATALAIVKEQGIEALTARSLAKELDSSARPIFTVFSYFLWLYYVFFTVVIRFLA